MRPSPRLLRSLLGALALLAVAPGCTDDDDTPGTPDAGTTPPDPGTPVVPERTSCSGLTLGPGDHSFTLEHQGRTRFYAVHLPTGYDATKPTPTVLNFHGYSSNEVEQAVVSKMTREADTQGFIAVYPRGLNYPEVTFTQPDGGPSDDTRSWNAGGCCGPSQIFGVDDVGFVDALLADLSAKACLDARRIFATGLSNGGFFSYRLACERSGLIAAIAPVAGMEAAPSCNPSRPVPVLHFHGTADKVISYDGGTIPFGGPYPPAPESVARWAPRNGCTGPVTVTYQQGDTTCHTHTGCTPESAQATLCTVTGGGHTWPSGFYPPGEDYGYTTLDIDATRYSWQFFQARPRP
jgi:polyhydroxybutyrate depolymerase